MPRARNPARETARKMWLDSGKTAKLKDIAASLELPESRIRKWKCEDNWETERSVSNAAKKSVGKKERKGTQKPDPPPKKRGAQPGNKNGKGGPPGNKKALVTGAFETIFFDSFTEEERALVEAVYDEKKELLKHQINTLLVRERRMLQRIAELRSGMHMLTKSTHTTAEPTGAKTADGRDATRVVQISQSSEAHDERVLRFEDSLTRVQSELRRCIDSLRQLEENSPSGDESGTLADAIMAAYNMRKVGDNDA